MKELGKKAIKYFLILLTIGLFNGFLANYHLSIILKLGFDNPIEISKRIIVFVEYSQNIIIGIFILIDSIKELNNKVLVSILAFLIPIIGICFFLIEKYFLLKTIEDEQ